ncbi:MAG TPA: adenine deaminase [Niabella sp.]|nr:adenine deaminase [Niabella sp.]HOZ96272.1 adenine deaminase [Niabella sp.]HQW14654.1 adenine deaminase [Niabella sp.]HQX19793.1 adenine deaminase [Niabella sp.]HQX41107.1 adenine deaminase [Niabella sp.]
MIIEGNIVDIENRSVYAGVLRIEKGQIIGIEPTPQKQYDHYILPGFIDSHVHIESSMLVPSEFAKMAVVHGTVSTVSDPHEIANVCGLKGVEYMIENGKTVPFKFNFGAPSCVPATVFETAGDTLSVEDVKTLLNMEEIKYLAEMMNFPGVLFQDKEVMAKIEAAKALGKPIDGHAPGLKGEDAIKYIQASGNAGVVISTDHECFTLEEAQDKLNAGMKILIREGSAAKNFEALIELLHHHPNQIMFCSDDKHPDSLLIGHINQLCARAVAKGIDKFHVLRAACINPVVHYKLDVGLLNVGDPADFILVKDLIDFEILATYIIGEKVAENGKSLIQTQPAPIINHFKVNKKLKEVFAIKHRGEEKISVIEAMDGQLITNHLKCSPNVMNGFMESDVERDILKIAVVNRYQEATVAVGFIKNFGLRQGAIASSVAHDSHNIVVVGVDDESICKAVNLIISANGGVCCVSGKSSSQSQEVEGLLALPVAGIMTNLDGYETAEKYIALDAMAKEFGCTLQSPFMTLSFMALLVIPALKMSDKGLFDGDKFEFVYRSDI